MVKIAVALPSAASVTLGGATVALGPWEVTLVENVTVPWKWFRLYTVNFTTAFEFWPITVSVALDDITKVEGEAFHRLVLVIRMCKSDLL